MKLTMIEKLNMCKEHVIDKKTISHVSERYGNYSLGNLKYLINLYKKYGEKPFINRENGTYQRDTKLLAINKVKNGGESIRSVALDLELIDPSILRDWIKKYDKDGEESIQDTYPRKNYLNDEERYKKNIDKRLEEENIKLKAEIEYLKKSQSLAQKLEDLQQNKKFKLLVS